MDKSIVIKKIFNDASDYWKTLTIERIIIFQCLGVFLLTIGVTSCSYGQIQDVCVPNMVFWISILSAPFTGAQYNMMVTLTWLFRKNFHVPLKYYVYYIGSQIVGAFLGGIVLYFLHNQIRAPQIKYQDQIWLQRDMIMQAFISGLYACIYQMINNKQTSFLTNMHTTVIIGAAGVLFSRQYSVHSGACMNPSIAMGLNFSKALLQDAHHLKYLYVYIIFPTLGSFIGTKFFDYIYIPFLRKSTK